MVVILSVVVHPIGNKIIVCYVIFTSKYEISFPVTAKGTIHLHFNYVHINYKLECSWSLTSLYITNYKNVKKMSTKHILSEQKRISDYYIIVGNLDYFFVSIITGMVR